MYRAYMPLSLPNCSFGDRCNGHQDLNECNVSTPPVYPPGFRNHSGWGWWPEPPCTCDPTKLSYSQRHIGRQPTFQTGDRFVLNENQDAMVGCDIDPVEQSWSLGY
jgi:hypothetical protein